MRHRLGTVQMSFVLALVIIAVLWMILGRGPSRSGRMEDGAFAPLMAEAVVPFTSTV